MTFLGIKCSGDYAEVVTDTASYSQPNMLVIRRTNKVDTWMSHRAVITGSGDGDFVSRARRVGTSACFHHDTFDEVLDAAPVWLKVARDEMGTDSTAGTVFLIGWSDRAEQFIARAYPVTDLDGHDLDGLHIQPTPYELRPGQAEATRIRRGLLKLDLPENDVELTMAGWLSRPAPPVDEPTDWVGLAEQARRSRALAGPDLRAAVAGELTHTLLTREGINQQHLHQFNDTGDELDALVAGTLHPRAQHAPCAYCDSGKPAVSCCMSVELDQPCECRSGDTFRDCCLRDEPAPDAELWTAPRMT